MYTRTHIYTGTYLYTIHTGSVDYVYVLYMIYICILLCIPI